MVGFFIGRNLLHILWRIFVRVNLSWIFSQITFADCRLAVVCIGRGLVDLPIKSTFIWNVIISISHSGLQGVEILRDHRVVAGHRQIVFALNLRSIRMSLDRLNMMLLGTKTA